MSCIVASNMSDDIPGESKTIEAPQLTFVKGGTSTQKSEELFARRQAEGEARRRVSDREKAAAAGQKQVEGEDGSKILMPSAGGAVQYSSQMTAHPEVPKAYVKLIYLTRKGEPAYWPNGEPVECLADVIVGANPEHPTEMCLVLVCPRCQATSHKAHQDNQIRIFQSNKHFELEQRGEPMFTFREWDEKANAWVDNLYRSAGVIVESERFDCPDCGWRARITENRVRPD